MRLLLIHAGFFTSHGDHASGLKPTDTQARSSFESAFDLTGVVHISTNSNEPFEIVDFVNDIPPYAILSHTWGDEEVSFQDLRGDIEAAKRKKGYAKILGACGLAQKEGFDYIWVDSCCINKESSAELSEALNSMFQHYENSEVCYAYLSDVKSNEDPRSGDSMFSRCKWFTRGWTLQELIAPTRVVFYDADWVQIGDKVSLHDAVTGITGIPTQVLIGGDLRSAGIAKKMSWAAFRETTRPEDRAYSLMGLFQVNMPPIYGEGLANAFMRLQREIISSSNDRSIFAWAADPDDHDLDNRGLLAKSPFEFRCSGNVGVSELSHLREGSYWDSSFSMTNSGLRIHLPLSSRDDGLFVAFLNCKDATSRQQLAIYLRRGDDASYIRCRADHLLLESVSRPREIRQIDVKEGSGVSHGPLRIRTRWHLPETWSAEHFDEYDWRPFPDNVQANSTRNYLSTDINAVEVTLHGEEEKVFSFKTKDDIDSRGFAVACRISKTDSSMLLTKVVPVQRYSDLLRLFFKPFIVDPAQVSPSYRAATVLPSGELISSVVYKTSHNSSAHWNLDIRVTPGRATLPKELSPPHVAFMVQTAISPSLGALNLTLQLQKVLPTDFFRRNHSPNRTYISMDVHAPRILVYELTHDSSFAMNLRSPILFAVVLGVEDSRVWSQMVHISDLEDIDDGTTDIIKIIRKRGTHTRRWEDEEPYTEHLQFRREMYDFVNVVVDFSVTVGRKDDSMLQFGTHWARIGMEIRDPTGAESKYSGTVRPDMDAGNAESGTQPQIPAIVIGATST